MEQQTIASGTCAVSKKKRAVMDAYLGTCVGVAMCDRKAKVGGILHILLPEPTGTDVPFRPETYASTGIPHFIGLLCDAGASKKRLEASVAGGALVGPVSDRDLSLNIGGRTTEVVQSILAENGIAVGSLEAGGYFSCRLRLDLHTFQSTIVPILDSNGSGAKRIKKPSRTEIHKAIEIMRPIPQIALKILHMIQEDDSSMKEIGREVRRDQVISAKTINLCNSAQFGLRCKVDSIDRALILLGEKRLLQLVVSASVETMFPESSQGYSLCKGGIFRHALGTAMISGELAAFTGRAAPDIAYTAGLLHDIGKIPLDQYVAPVSPYFYRAAHDEGVELCKVECDHFGISHPEVGGMLGERWALPANLTDCIRHHHGPEDATVDRDLATLVYLGDLLMSRFQVAQELERLNTNRFKTRLKQVGLSTEHFPIIIDRIPRTVFQGSPEEK